MPEHQPRRGAPARRPTAAAAAHAPWKPTILEERKVQAIRAVYEGRAGEEEQRRAMRAIIEDLCGYGGEAFRPGPDGSRETDYALGMMKIGREIWKCVFVDFEELKRRREQGL